MNKILLILMFLFLSVSVTHAQVLDGNEKEIALVKLNSSEEDLLFYIDDSLVGRIIDSEYEIIAGFHKLKLSSATDSWSAVDWSWEGELISDSTYIFTVESKQFIMLNTVPFGAKVVIEGKIVGSTPFMHEKTGVAVEIVMTNYMPVRLEASKLADKKFIDITLVNETPSEEIESMQLLNGIANRRDKLISRSTYILTGVSGIAAVYFKFVADEAFRDLPNAILLEDQIYLQDRIKKYDDLAAVSFGTFQVGFLYSIYRVIRR